MNNKLKFWKDLYIVFTGSYMNMIDKNNIFQNVVWKHPIYIYLVLYWVVGSKQSF